MGQIEIGFFEKGTSEKDAVDKMMEFVKNYSQFEGKEKQDWMVQYYTMTSPYEESRQYIFGDLILGVHDNQYFYIYVQMDCPDGYEAFYPIQRAILNQWVWKDKSLPLFK